MYIMLSRLKKWIYSGIKSVICWDCERWGCFVASMAGYGAEWLLFGYCWQSLQARISKRKAIKKLSYAKPYRVL